MPLIVLAAASLVSADIKCGSCGNSITGAYYVSPDGGIYCESCWKGSAICAQCGKMTRSPVKAEGLDFCPECYAKLPRCSLCSRPLVGSFTRYSELGLQVCPICEKEKPRCQRCGLPMDKFIVLNDTKLCMNCASQVERCHSCGDPILGEYSYFEGNQAFKYCLSCVKNYPRCDNCGAPSGPDGTRLADGRHLCPECRRVALFDIGLVDPIKKRVMKFVTSNMNMAIMRPIDFSLRDKDFLQSKAKGIHGDLNGLFYRRGNDFHIYVLYGLREKDYVSVLAHEIGHAWQAENCSDDLPLEDLEGFAQWIAYKTLLNFGYRDFAELLKEGDSIYAKGLNNMLKIEKYRGAQAVFNHVREK